MSKKILILLGFLFLILFLGNISAVDMCWFAENSGDCELNGYKVVMSLSDSTNAHGALAGQGSFAGVLCCNFGQGDTTCAADNKILGLSSSTNAHAEAPDITPTYTDGVCYDSLKDCRETTENCGVDEIPVLYLSSGLAQLYTNAHIEEAGLTSQNYDSKICCVVDKPELCDLTSAEWGDEDGDVLAGTDVDAIVNGIYCSEAEISFEVSRRKSGPDESCSSIDGCENPANAVFGAGSNSVGGIWNASPSHDKKYYFKAKVVANPDESVQSGDLLVSVLPPGYCDSIAICSQYDEESNCNSNICDIDVQDSAPSSVNCDASDITCYCEWNDGTNECAFGWGIVQPSCPPGPDPKDVCEGVMVPVYDDNGDICDVVYGIKDCIPVCPDGPDPATICAIGLIVPVYDENNDICKVVIGTKDCIAVCPTGPDPATICSGEFEFVTDTDGYICKVVWGTQDCVVCPSKPTADEVCVDVTVHIYDTAGELCRTVNGEKVCTAVCPVGPDPATVCDGLIVPVYDEEGHICKVVVGTKDCTTVCPNGPDPKDVCSGTIAPIYDGNGYICDVVYGIKDCTGVCPVGPDPSTICSIGLIVPVYDNYGELCKVVTGTKDCTAVCPDGPAPATICEGEFELVTDGDGYICKVVWGTQDCVICPSKPTADEVCVDVTVHIYDTAGNLCRTVVGTQDCTALCPIGPSPSTICEGIEVYVYDEDGYICKVVVGTKDCAEGGLPVGTCTYTQSIDDNCDTTGFLTINWTATWTWAESCDPDCQLANADKAAQCKTLKETKECPAQIPLPFFNIYSFVATLIIIALIYTAIIISKKKKIKIKFT